MTDVRFHPNEILLSLERHEENGRRSTGRNESLPVTQLQGDLHPEHTDSLLQATGSGATPEQGSQAAGGASSPQRTCGW